MSSSIVVKGAREHNLRNVDVTIPRDKLVVITGLSGSGKSSLAFDTIYAEGQRRYVESLSAYARQFLDQIEKPDVDSIEGLSPAISIEQKTVSRNPRSTVGTVTEIYDFLRLLFSTVGVPHCFECGEPITTQDTGQIVDQILALETKSRVEILAPVVRARKGEYKRELAELRKHGFVKVRIDGEIRDLEDDIRLTKSVHHTIEVVVDRIIIKPTVEKRLRESIDVALRVGGDNVTITSRPPGSRAKPSESTFSRRFACATCGVSYPEVSPRLFSFNSPQGACGHCSGIGRSTDIDPRLAVVDDSLPVSKGAIGPWGKRLATKYKRQIDKLLTEYGTPLDTPFSKIPEQARERILWGKSSSIKTKGRQFSGIFPILMKRYKESESDWVRGELEKYMVEQSCSSCDGARLRAEARHVLVGGKSIVEVSALPVEEAVQWFKSLKLKRREHEIAKLILKEIEERLRFMLDVGLGYLRLDRHAGTLSGGEGQRIRLATQIGAGLSGVLYVLDEPSIGLHPRDNKRLLGSLRELANSGNSVLVVEHDADTMNAAGLCFGSRSGGGAGRRRCRGQRYAERSDEGRGVGNRPVSKRQR